MRLEAAADHLCPRGRGASRGAPRRCPVAFPGSALLGVRVPPTVLGLPRGARPLSPFPRSPLQGGQEAHAPGGPEVTQMEAPGSGGALPAGLN